MRTLRSAVTLAVVLLGCWEALAQAVPLPLQILQDLTLDNAESYRGAPLSSTVNVPAGSDGRAPTIAQQDGWGLTKTLPTIGQFQSWVSFGGLAAPTDPENFVEGGNYADNAVRTGLPVARSGGSVVAVLRSARVGAPYVSRRVSYLFGSIVAVPETDENGALLSQRSPPVRPEDYWLAEPYWTDKDASGYHQDASYCWSPNARTVFAVQAGPVLITWKKAKPNTTTPPDPENYVLESGAYYRLHQVQYVVSGSACKRPHTIYWTQGDFRNLGKPVAVPAGRIQTIHVVFNSNFPELVDHEYRDPGKPRNTDATSYEEKRTLWFEEGQIRAYNREGRVFVEFLGEYREDGKSRQHLGYEIVDVYQQATPADVLTELGEPLRAFADGQDDSWLKPEERQAPSPPYYGYQHTQGGKSVFYAIRETQNLNDYFLFWMEEGELELLWPLRLARYRMIWPPDIARYSHYVRPRVATADEAAETAVSLPLGNVPTIEYQDPLDQERAYLTADFKFYTFLEPAYPAHRTLLRLDAGPQVAFERVFSWLDEGLRHPNLSRPAFDTDFTTPPSGASLLGHAQIEGGLLHLTDALANQWGDYVLDDFTGGATVRNFRATFKASLRDGTTTQADGFSFNFGTLDPRPKEEGTADGLAISFDAYDNSGDPNNDVAPTISIKLDGTIVAAVAMGEYNRFPDPAYVLPIPTDRVTGQPMTLFTGEQFVDVEVELRRDGQVDVWYKGVKVLADVATGYAPRTGQFGFGGRTGGLYQAHWIDDLTIVVNVDPAAGSHPFAASVATNLNCWVGNATFNWPNAAIVPRVVENSVEVGQRITAPSGELGSEPTADYWAGHLRTEIGTSYHPQAYTDPFVAGFSAANRGAIIPVNTIPDANRLEVWWFRPNAPDRTQGFETIYWPSVIGRYTIQWLADPGEIVLASNNGSGGLPSLQAKGSIYYQNDPNAHGYNPNEEHALMLAGQAYALRDDLNVTSGPGYSSHPFVLLDYTEDDGRPAIRVFQVLREKPEDAILFDYLVEAGTILQAPMPLPLMEKPVEGSGASAVNYNSEPPTTGGDLPGNWNETTHGHGPYQHYPRFTYEDRKHSHWVYRGVHAGPPTLEAGQYVYDEETETGAFEAAPAAKAVVDNAFRYCLHASRLEDSLTLKAASGTALPGWLRLDGLELKGTPRSSDVGSTTLNLRLEAMDDDSHVTVTLDLEVVSSGSVVAQDPLEITSHNAYSGEDVTFVDRPPYLAVSPTSANSFTMRFYYKTRAGFAWPGVADPPAVGSIVPYLRPKDSGGNYVGDPTAKETDALDIVYRPYWPFADEKLPQLDLGDTLTTSKNNLPAVRGQSSLEVLYQQSIAADLVEAQVSAILHDATREKSYDISDQNLDKLPGGVRSESYQGKTYFPNLPPHLVRRLCFDPNRGSKGHLVFRGEFKDESVGEKYLLLNVLRGQDLASVKNLCPDGDADKTHWDAAIDGLSAVIETFIEDPNVPGQYIPDDDLTTQVGVGDLAEIGDDDTAVDSYALSASGPGTGYLTLIAGNGVAFTPTGDPVAVHVLKVRPRIHVGEVKPIVADNPLSELVTFQHTADLGGRFNDFEYEWRIAPPRDGQPPEITPGMEDWTLLSSGLDQPRYTLGGAGIQALSDNYVVLRYRAKNAAHPLYDQWSDWTEPQLAEGWIKRVLAGINPFNQRVNDLFNNQVNTDVSMLTQAGARWEGDIALSLENIDDHGLIEIYETVLNRGKMLSIGAGINYGPANDALLLAAGYLNDLYLMLGNEAWADAANPTIGIGTKDHTYGEIATALFAFKGQVATLLEEELGLLRGHDDFLQPGVETRPVYNRFFWNYTRGIDSGEVIYALNYNIQEDPNASPDGVVNAEDARRMYPQGHGDAYGHYLTALKGYYTLLLDTDFDWVPRTEAVTVLGKAIQVDYMDERKFAAAAAAVVRAGRQVFDLTWRKDYQPAVDGWEHFAATRDNDRRDPASTRHWGLDYWASRVGEGAYLHWITGNAILPDVDPDPGHEGIQKIDRTTVPELQELVSLAKDLQTAMDNAEGRLSPLGLPQDAIVFDLNPTQVLGAENHTHFEQVYARARAALKNALAAFDDAKDVTRLMRSEEDSLAAVRFPNSQQEFAYETALIEIYGTPYPDDIGPGKTYKQGYTGPDLIHYPYVDLPEISFGELWNYTEVNTFVIDLQDVPDDWTETLYKDFDFIVKTDDEDHYGAVNQLEFNLGPHGYSDKPSSWTGQRAHPGAVQQAISEFILAHRRLRGALYANSGGKADLDKAARLFEAQKATLERVATLERENLGLEDDIADLESKYEVLSKDLETAMAVADMVKDSMLQDLPESSIFGTAFGGDTMFPARAIICGVYMAAKLSLLTTDAARHRVVKKDIRDKKDDILKKAKEINEKQLAQTLQDGVYALFKELEEVQAALDTIQVRLRELDDAERKVRAVIAQGERVQEEREICRQRAAALIHGYRTRDAAFRIFRTEKLERYKTLFDLAARYALLAANAYDYETGLLGTSPGRSFINRIISARALGVLRDGEPQYAGSNTGDPGLSSALAEMKADWDVLKGRLGFNNPDAYGTTVSLRTENFRILPTADGDAAWKDLLHSVRRANLLDDPDVQRSCLQIDRGDGLPVPGLLLEFTSTIENGYNWFGQVAAAGDHAFSPSSFATKIHAVGVVFDGYRGMTDPTANSGAVGSAGGTSPPDPSLWFLDPLALMATPYVYLIPAGLDSLRTPPLGDARDIRVWSVKDVVIPLPFNIGESEFSASARWQSDDFLSEPLFAIRKHQAFRPVSTAGVFTSYFFGSTGQILPSQFTNNRLIGRSVWNSKWKLVIPGHTLLNDPNEGLERFIQTVRDIKLHLVTYSYAGN